MEEGEAHARRATAGGAVHVARCVENRADTNTREWVKSWQLCVRPRCGNMRDKPTRFASRCFSASRANRKRLRWLRTKMEPTTSYRMEFPLLPPRGKLMTLMGALM